MPDALITVPRRPHDEGDVVFLVVGPEPGGVEAAWRVGGDFQFEVGVPLAVVERIVDEVDGGVLFGRVAKTQFVTGPVGTTHGTDREVDQPAVGAIGGDVDDVVRVECLGKVPSSADVGSQRQG